MPVRNTPLVNNYYYHLFNRSVAKIPIFISKADYFRAWHLLNYYRFQNTPFSFSKFKKLNKKQQEDILKDLEKKEKKLVMIVSFCLMPNHFHLLVKQIQNQGIRIFLRNFQNSYAKYFNIKYKRVGSLFQNRFKAVRVEDNNQLLHLNRYIHLNPYSSLVVKDKKALLNFNWSSLPEFLKNNFIFCQPKIILDQFKSGKSYRDFIFDQADYQKKLARIKHLVCE